MSLLILVLSVVIVLGGVIGIVSIRVVGCCVCRFPSVVCIEALAVTLLLIMTVACFLIGIGGWLLRQMCWCCLTLVSLWCVVVLTLLRLTLSVVCMLLLTMIWGLVLLMIVVIVSLGRYGSLTPCISIRLSGVLSVCVIGIVIGILLCGSVSIIGGVG